MGVPIWLALPLSSSRSQNLLFRPSRPWSTRRPVCPGRLALGSVAQPCRQTSGQPAGWDSPQGVWSLLCGVASTPESRVVPGFSVRQRSHCAGISVSSLRSPVVSTEESGCCPAQGSWGAGVLSSDHTGLGCWPTSRVKFGVSPSERRFPQGRKQKNADITNS